MPAGFDGTFDWDFLTPAFGSTNIQPMDIDYFVERNGWFLVIETKGRGVKVPLGQQIALENLVRRGHFIVLIVWGKRSTEIRN